MPAAESRAPMLAAKSVVERIIAGRDFGVYKRRRARGRVFRVGW